MSATPLYGRCYRGLFYYFFLNSVFSIFTKEKCAIDSAKSPSPLFENRLRVLCYVFQQRNERNAQHGDSLKPVRLVRRKNVYNKNATHSGVTINVCVCCAKQRIIDAVLLHEKPAV